MSSCAERLARDRARAERRKFWLDPEIGPWGSPAAVYPEFARELASQTWTVPRCLRAQPDAIFNDTMPSGAAARS